jgi:proline iminopeptidase
MEKSPAAEGDIVVHPDGHRVHWWRYGSGSQTVVVLHGGPGYDHRHQLGFARLAEGDVQIVFYDQLGSGRSDRPEDEDLWVVPRFVDELETIRRELHLGRIHLVGHSWGGFLAQAYVLAHPDGVASLVLANTAASCQDLAESFAAVRAAVPQPARDLMDRREAAGEWDAPDYQEAVLREIMAVNFRRTTPFDHERSLQELVADVMPMFEDSGPSRLTMFGDRPFEITGNLVDWDVKDRLHEIDAPTLVVSSSYDAISPECAREIADRIAGSSLVILGQSSHMVMLEHEAPVFFGVVGDFVRRHATA